MIDTAPGPPVAITPQGCLKRALLLFPHVVWPGFRFINLDLVPDWLDEERRQHAGSSDEYEQEYLRELERLAAKHPDRHPNALINCAWVRSIATVYVNRGQSIVYLYDDKLPGLLEGGREIGYRAALNGLKIIDESQVTMEQVEEFRRDPETTRKYRALRLWLHQGLGAESVDHANDIVTQKLDDYTWAMEKHGLATITGAIESIVDSKHIAAIAGGTGMAALCAGPVWASIAGGLMVGAEVATWIAKRAISLEDVKRGPHSEVAIIYEARKRFTQ